MNITGRAIGWILPDDQRAVVEVEGEHIECQNIHRLSCAPGDKVEIYVNHRGDIPTVTGAQHRDD